MSIFKDWLNETDGYSLSSRFSSAVSPATWLRLAKWRRQRANRGWSDRDAWNAGDHIAKMTAEMLQKLNDNHIVDWPEWFKLNVQEDGKGAYKSLQAVIDDIDNYLKFQWTTWADDLESVTDPTREFNIAWVDKKGKKLTQQELAIRIKRHQKKEANLYKKATKAMAFFGRHFSSFWD